MSTTKRITKRLIAVVLTVLMLMSMVTIGMTSASAAYVDIAQTGVNLTGGEVLYLKPGVWVADNARFAAHFCNGTSAATWANMTDPDGDGQYEVTVPANSNHKNVIFCRMNPSATANNWNNKWNQSNDLTYDGSKNLYTITGWGPDGGKSPGSWSVYVPPAPAKPGDASGWNVIGDFNGDTFTKLNSLVYAEDTSIATHTMELDQGTYKFKVVDDAKSLWLDYTKLAPKLTNGGGTLSTDGTKDNNVKLVADGGTYTFNYTVKTQKLDIVYTAPVVEPPVAPATPEATITAIGANGTGTVEDPYVAKAGTEVQFNIAAKGEATGFEYIINGGEVTTEATFKATAPAAGTEVTYTVDVYAYNENTEGKESSEPCTLTFVLKGEEEVVIDPNGTPFAIDWAEEDGLYVYAGDADKITEENKPDTEAWQCWLEKSTGNCVVYLPASANAEKVAIFNAYDHTICVGATPIDAGCYEIVEYVEGTTYNTTKAEDQTLTIYRTDAEVSLFINTDKENGSVVNESEVETGLKDLTDKIWYDYITEASKNREAKKLGGAVAFDDGVVVEGVKKIKGRGNSTWSETKKPFNITFNSKIAIDGMDKFGKWSLLANAKDDSLMRNRLVYDMANEVNMKYACDSRFVDFFVDGKYMGSYQLVQKIEMELGSVMSDLEEPIVKAKNEGDVVPVENFDFVLELDTQNNANGAGDKTFKTGRKQVMTHKIPDEPTAEQVEFMKAKYQALEDAIYGDNLADLVSIIDINDFVRAYLVNEIAKNIDTGVTSCYFVYNSNEGKFYASPVWDYDNALGNMKNGRENINGETLSIIDTDGWYTREMSHDQDGFTGGRGIFSQAYYMTSKTADGKTFADIAAEIWATDFADIDDILAGDIKAEHGRLKSIEEYKALLAKSGKWNYEKTWKADNGWTLTQNWTADHSKLTMYDYDAESNTYTVTGKTYKENVPADMNQFVGDWLISRINWIDAQYNEAEEVLPEGYIKVYFENNWKWPDAKTHYWGSATGVNTTWPGMELTNIVGQNADGFDIYEIVIPGDVEGILFYGTGEFGEDKSENITEVSDGLCYYMVYDETTKTKIAESYEYKPPVDPDDPIDPDDPVVEKMNIFLNATAWAQNGATYTVHYVVPAEGEDEGVATASIGEDTAVMSLIADNVYVAEIPANATNVQFAKNTVSNDELAVATVVTTDLLTIENGKNYYTITDVNAEEGTITGSWSVYGADVDPEIPAVGTVVVYVVNSKNWETVNAYIWSGSGDTAEPAVEWPGVALQPTGEKSTYGSDVYAMTFESKYTSVLFNNGTLKTKDLTVKDGQYYDLSNGQWYETLVEVPDPLPVSDPATVYFQNNWLWTEVSVYAYDADGNEFMGGWPGQAMELYGNDGTYDVYKAVIPSGATGFVINGIKNNSTEEDQTPDITTYAEGDCFSMMWADKNTVVVNNIDVILPPAMTTVYLNVADVWDVADGIVTVDDAVMENIHGTFYKAEIREDATEITFSLTQTSVEEGASVTKLTVPATRVEGKDLFTLTAVDVGEWGVYEEPIKPVDNNYYIHSDFAGEWGDIVLEGEGTVLTATAELEYGTYQFKITQNGKWYGNNGTIEDTCEGWHFKEKDAEGNDTKDCTLKATGGTYTFTFDTETMMLTVTAELTPPEFEVTYNNGNFTFEGDETATLDEAYTFTVTPEDGFVIAAVIYDMEELEAVDGVYTIENVQGDINLYIVTALESSTPPNSKFTVIFLKDDGSIYATRKEIQPGTLHPLPPAPYKEGYIFKGWSPEVEIVKNDAGQDCIEVTKDYVFSPVFEEDTNDLPLIPVPTDPPVEPEVKTYTVIFIDDNNKFIEFQTVEEGKDATLPEAPARAGYTFKEWSGEYTNVTENRTIVAVYTKNTVTPPAPATHGTLKVDVTGGTGFTMTVDGVSRPQGTTYYNSNFAIGTTVTLTASATSGAKFIGWVNDANSIRSTSETYTFVTTGSDQFKAVYEAEVEGVELVVFQNDKTNAILDMQYYASTDAIEFPADALSSVYDFIGWSFDGETIITEADIQAAIANGESVTVIGKWERKAEYVTVTIIGGTGKGTTNAQGQYLKDYSMTITAGAAPEGKSFVYWRNGDGVILTYEQTYVLYPSTDMTVEAVFAAEDEELDYAVLLNINTITEEASRTVYNYSWYTPVQQAGFTHQAAGMIFVLESNYDENNFTVDSQNIVKATTSLVQSSGTTNQGKGMKSGETWYARAWVQYLDADGNLQYAYSDVTVITKG